MKNKVAFVVSVVLAFGVLLSGCLLVSGESRKPLHVLMIGNSFSVSCMSYLPQVAAGRGFDLDLVSANVGGCTLRQHLEFLNKSSDPSFRVYQFDRATNGRRVATNEKRNLLEILRMEKWDVITVQQASHESWQERTDHRYGGEFVARLRALAPQAKIWAQETWSYTPFDMRLAKWGIDADGMYAGLHKGYAGFARQCGIKIIPFGTAVQEWRRRLPVRYGENSFGGDVVGGRWTKPADQFKLGADGKWMPVCDVFHLNERGEYFQALVWAKTLLGLDLGDFDDKPDFVTDAEAKLMREIAAKDF